MQNLGNFQAGMGKIGADANLMGAYIGATILILIAVGFGVMAFVPMTSGDCNENNNDVLSQNTCEKKNYYWFLLISLGLVLLAIFTVWSAKWWKQEITHNKTAQEVGGTLFEAQLVKNILQK